MHRTHSLAFFSVNVRSKFFRRLLASGALLARLVSVKAERENACTHGRAGRGGVLRDGERAPTISIRAGIFGSSRLPREYTTLLCSNNVIPRLSLDKSVSQSVVRV